MTFDELVRWFNANAGAAQVIGPLAALLLSGAGWAVWQFVISRSAKARVVPAGSSTAFDRIFANREIRVGVLDYMPLMGFRRHGDEFEGIGIYPRMLSRIAQDHGLSVDWYPINWSDILTAIDTGKIDVVASIFWTEKRSEVAAVCGKMHRIGVTALVLADDDRVKSHEDLQRSDLKIGVVRGEIGWEYAIDTLRLEFDPRLKVQDEINISRSVEMIEKGMVSVVLADALSCWMAAKQNRETGGRVRQIFADDALYVCDNGFLIKRGDDRLRSWLDENVRRLRHDPALEEAEKSDLEGLERIVRRREP